MHERYPGIMRAALAMAYDSGGVHRERPEVIVRRQISEWIHRQPEKNLDDISQRLDGLTDDQLTLVSCGDQEEAKRYLVLAPPSTEEVLNRCFDEVF